MEIKKEDIQKLIYELKTRFYVDFSNYAENSFGRRVEYVLTTYNLPNVDQLILKIRDDRSMSEKLINDITVNTTELFRDPEVWIGLKRNIIPKLRLKPTINIWHSACSSGEEVYSMMILLNEAGLLDNAKILATDLNTNILKKAQCGTYSLRMQNSYFTNFDKVVRVNPLNSEEELDIPYTKYFDFDKEKGIFTAKDFLRSKPTFKQHNLLDPNYLKFDIIFCRNVIIYFNSEMQNIVIGNHNNALFDEGILILGAHESIAYLPIASKFNQKFMRGCYIKK